MSAQRPGWQRRVESRRELQKNFLNQMFFLKRVWTPAPLSVCALHYQYLLGSREVSNANECAFYGICGLAFRRSLPICCPLWCIFWSTLIYSGVALLPAIYAGILSPPTLTFMLPPLVPGFTALLSPAMQALSPGCQMCPIQVLNINIFFPSN